MFVLQSGSVWAERLTHTAGGYSPAGHTEPRRPLHAMMKQTLGYCVDLKSNNDIKFELKARLVSKVKKSLFDSMDSRFLMLQFKVTEVS